jgi:hypothetical protein
MKALTLLTTTWFIIPALLLMFRYKKLESKHKQLLILLMIPFLLRLVFDKRIGANCCDGSESTSVGSGTCSWHTGVCYWKYKSFIENPMLNILVGGRIEYSVPTSNSLF